MSLHWCKKDKD